MNPVEVDLRALVTASVPSKLLSPVLITCPCHDDPGASLGVYHDHLYCHGKCQRHFRRYEGVALLLGWWDGRPETVKPALAKVYSRLDSLPLAERVDAVNKPVKPVDPSLADTFHRYLLSQAADLAFFKSWRGLAEKTIDELNLGFTGSHFTIPVYGRGGELCGVRYRMDPRHPGDGPKYSGITGHNQAMAYCLKTLKIDPWRSIWLFEGEYDAAVGYQIGVPAVTMTNGAGQIAPIVELAADAGFKPNKWVLALDQDEAGEKAAWELKQQLGSAAIRARWDPKYKDITELVKAGGDRWDIRLNG